MVQIRMNTYTFSVLIIDFRKGVKEFWDGDGDSWRKSVMVLRLLKGGIIPDFTKESVFKGEIWSNHKKII